MHKHKRFIFLLMLIFASAPVIDCTSQAGEVIFPVPSYDSAELKKVEAWEKTFAGQRITSTNVDTVKEFLHEAVYKIMKNPDLMGSRELWFEIVPYRPYEISPGRIAQTLRYAVQSRLDQKENLVAYGEVAGVPFPKPASGIEMAWNFDSNTRGDSSRLKHTGSIVDCRSGHERESVTNRWELSWIGRCDVPPIPKIADADNKRGIARTFFQRHLAPPDFVDTSLLEVRYRDHREEDLWVYTAAFRRIRRYPTSQRTDTIDGTDMIYDDQDGWYTHPTRNAYTAQGRADLLVSRHQAPGNLQRTESQGFWSGLQRERANHWVVEVVNKEPEYIYSRQIWYLDPETWQMNFKVMYNRRGELWKLYEFCHHEFPSHGGGKTAMPNAEHIVDIIRRHGSPAVREIMQVGGDIPLKQFTVNSLREKTY